MATVGDQLHQAREARRLTVEQVAEITKIRSDHLRALEEGNFNVFSAPVYIRGFVRCYSTLLKLDVPHVMLALEAELGQNRKFAEPPPLSNRPRGVLDFLMLQLAKAGWQKSLAWLGTALAVLGLLFGYTLWRHWPTADPLQGLKPAVYKPHSPGQTLPLPPTAPKK
jgi:cytoskeletal protein RodZ